MKFGVIHMCPDKKIVWARPYGGLEGLARTNGQPSEMEDCSWR